jgi:uncharacterized protein YcbK (DUF882 family)
MLFWVAACGGMLSSQLARAESRALVPIVADESEFEEASFAAEDAARPNPAPLKSQAGARKVSAPKRPGRGTDDAVKLAVKQPTGKQRGKAPQRRPERQPTEEYQRIRDGWHAAIAREPVANVPATPLAPLVLAPVNGGERVTLTPASEEGGFSQDELLRAARAFTPAARAKAHPVAPRLLDLVYRAMRHFDAPLVHLVSGYRADRAGSRHTQGRAIDLVIPGVSNDELAAYVRGFGFVGVGVYPKSGFVHLDVRDTSFFWIDDSLPDERCRTQPVMAEEAKLADQSARDRGEGPNAFVPDNEREDRAAARAYQRRAQQRRAASDHVRSF